MFRRSTCLWAVVIADIIAFPVTDTNSDWFKTFDPNNCDTCTDWHELVRLTRETGMTAVDGITDTAVRIRSALADIANTVFVQTGDLLADGQVMVVDNFEEVKKLGEKGIDYVEKAFATTGEFVSKNLYKLPFAVTKMGDNRQEQDT